MIVNYPALLLDACCLINLHVSGRLPEIVSSLGLPVRVSEIVWEEEVPTLREAGNEGAELAVSSGLIEVVPFGGKEADDFIDFAAELGDDGESASCAIAFNRAWAIATDDRAAIKFIRGRVPEQALVSSLQIVKYWADTSGPSGDDVKRVLVGMRDLARYAPGPSHPLWDWWRSVASSP